MVTDPARSGTGDAGAGPQRRTRQRSAVDAILRSGTDFRTAAQVHDALRHQGDSVGLTTVYRALQAMTEAGELDAIRTQDGETAYRRCSTGHHHHLVCRGCGFTVEVWGPAVETWTNRVSAEFGFTDVRHDLEIFGLCQDCSARAAAG